MEVLRFKFCIPFFSSKKPVPIQDRSAIWLRLLMMSGRPGMMKFKLNDLPIWTHAMLQVLLPSYCFCFCCCYCRCSLYFSAEFHVNFMDFEVSIYSTTPRDRGLLFCCPALVLDRTITASGFVVLLWNVDLNYVHCYIFAGHVQARQYSLHNHLHIASLRKMSWWKPILYLLLWNKFLIILVYALSQTWKILLFKIK